MYQYQLLNLFKSQNVALALKKRDLKFYIVAQFLYQSKFLMENLLVIIMSREQVNQSSSKLSVPIKMNKKIHLAALAPLFQRSAGRIVSSNHIMHQQSHCHSCPCFLFLIFSAGITITTILYVKNIMSKQVWLIVFGVLYLFQLIGLRYNMLLDYLYQVKERSFVEEYNRLRKIDGYFLVHSNCFRVQAQSNGHERYSSNIFAELGVIVVPVCNDTFKIIPNRTTDISGECELLPEGKNIAVVTFISSYTLADQESEDSLNNFFTVLQKKNKDSTYQNYMMSYTIPGVNNTAILYIGQNSCSYLMWYYLSGFMGLLWLYTIWLECKIIRFSIKITKQVKIV